MGLKSHTWAYLSPQARATWDPVSYSLGGLAIAQLAFGTRHTAGAIAALFALVFLIPQVIHRMPAPWDVRIGKYMLDNAGQQLVALHGAAGYFLPGPSLIVCATYVAVTLGAAAVLITRRDT